MIFCEFSTGQFNIFWMLVFFLHLIHAKVGTPTSAAALSPQAANLPRKKTAGTPEKG